MDIGRKATGGQSTIDLSDGQQTAKSNVKMVWNRRKQEWVEVQISEAENNPDVDEEKQKEESELKAPEQEIPLVEESKTSGVSGVSSNAYANGSNQNSGNFITDRYVSKRASKLQCIFFLIC